MSIITYDRWDLEGEVRRYTYNISYLTFKWNEPMIRKIFMSEEKRIEDVRREMVKERAKKNREESIKFATKVLCLDEHLESEITSVTEGYIRGMSKTVLRSICLRDIRPYVNIYARNRRF